MLGHRQLRAGDDGLAFGDRTFNTSGGGTGGTCANPVTFTSQSGNFNTTGAVCYRTSMNIARVGLLELRRTDAHGGWRGTHLRTAATHEVGRRLLLLLRNRGSVLLGKPVRLVGRSQL